MEQPPLTPRSAQIAQLNERLEQNQSQNMALMMTLLELRSSDQEKAAAREQELENKMRVLAQDATGLRQQMAQLKRGSIQKDQKEASQCASMFTTLVYDAAVQVGVEVIVPNNLAVKVMAVPAARILAKQGIFSLLPPKVAYLMKVGAYKAAYSMDYYASNYTNSVMDYLPLPNPVSTYWAKYFLSHPDYIDLELGFTNLSNRRLNLQGNSLHAIAVTRFDQKMDLLRTKLREFEKSGGHGYEKEMSAALAQLAEVDNDIERLEALFKQAEAAA